MPEPTVEERMAAAERVIERLRRVNGYIMLYRPDIDALLWYFDLQKAGREARRAIRNEEG